MKHAREFEDQESQETAQAVRDLTARFHRTKRKADKNLRQAGANLVAAQEMVKKAASSG